MSVVLGQSEYQLFDGLGGYQALMPRCITAGFKPLSVKDFMEGLVRAVDSNNPEAKKLFLDAYIGTSDGVAIFGNRGKLLLEPKILLNIKPDSKVSVTSLPIDEGQYGILPEEELRDGELSRPYLISDASQLWGSPVWIKLARGDSDLLREFGEISLEHLGRNYAHRERKGFGVYVALKTREPGVRAFDILGPGDWSYSLTDQGLLGKNTRLIGKRSVSPQAMETLDARLETVKR